MYIYGIDPGFANMGLAVWDKKISKVVFVSALHTSYKDDFGTRARTIFKWIKQIYKKYPPYFLNIEDVDYRSRFVDRRAQAYLTAGLGIILAALPDKAGYQLVNKTTLKKTLGYTQKKQGLQIFKIMKYLKKDDKEHIADSLSLLQYYLISDDILVSFAKEVIYNHNFDSLIIKMKD